MSLSNAAIREIHQLQTEADTILRATDVSRAEQKRADVIISKISSIRATGFSTDELTRTLATEQARELGFAAPRFYDPSSPEVRAYKKFLQGASEEEVRATALVAGGTSLLSYTQGPLGGFTVPQQYNANVREGMKLTDPLLDDSIVTVIQEQDYSLRPLSLPGWDLSSLTAIKVGEVTQENAAATPTLTTALLNKFAYRIALDMSMEWEEDAVAYTDPIAALSRAAGIAIGRGVGSDLANGSGGAMPQGIVTGAVDSGVTTANAGTIVHDDFADVFHSINPVYRNSPKCAWLVNDTVAKMIRKAKDSSNRPLFDTSDGVFRIYGKPVYTCPNLPVPNASLGTQGPGSFCVFGDLSAYTVHASAVLQRRLTQLPGLIEYGKVRLHSLIMVDAVVNDPTNGALPPIVHARLHS